MGNHPKGPNLHRSSAASFGNSAAWAVTSVSASVKSAGASSVSHSYAATSVWTRSGDWLTT